MLEQARVLSQDKVIVTESNAESYMGAVDVYLALTAYSNVSASPFLFLFPSLVLLLFFSVLLLFFSCSLVFSVPLFSHIYIVFIWFLFIHDIIIILLLSRRTSPSRQRIDLYLPFPPYMGVITLLVGQNSSNRIWYNIQKT